MPDKEFRTEDANTGFLLRAAFNAAVQALARNNSRAVESSQQTGTSALDGMLAEKSRAQL